MVNPTDDTDDTDEQQSTTDDAPPDTPGEAPPGSVTDQPALLGTSERMAPVDGIYAPEGDLPE